MMTFILSLALAAAGTQGQAADPTGSTQTAKPEKPKKICRTTKMTGSTIGRRVCKTQEQWDGQRNGNDTLDVMDQSYKQNIDVGASPLGGNN
jgi:hypothetical protein